MANLNAITKLNLKELRVSHWERYKEILNLDEIEKVNDNEI